MKKLVLLLLIISTVSVCAGDVIYVDCNAPGADNGSSWEDAYNFLQDALADAASDANITEIRAAKGTYTPDSSTADPNGTGDREASFNLISDIVLKGGFAGYGESEPNARDFEMYETILSGDLDGNDVQVGDPCDLLNEPTRGENSFNIIKADDVNNCVLDGFTVTGGNANSDETDYENGSAIRAYSTLYYISSYMIEIANCTFENNSSKLEGGAISIAGKAKIKDCQFMFNAACRGGVVAISEGYPWQLEITSSTFFANKAINGIDESYWTPPGTILPAAGGVVYLDYYPAEIKDCIFIGNQSEYIAGVIFEEGCFNQNLIMRNCLLAGNSANEDAGAVYAFCDEPLFTNCTISYNTAGNYVGGVYIDKYDSGSPSGSFITCPFCLFETPSPTFSNCILWGNSDSTGTGFLAQTGGGDPNISYSCVQGLSSLSDGNIADNPLFADANNDDYHLLSQAGRWDANSQSWVTDSNTSPCVDSGDWATPVGFEPFPNGGRVNMGAYGGTVEASKSYFGTEPCETIIAGDINGDCKVDFVDLAIMALHWLEEY